MVGAKALAVRHPLGSRDNEGEESDVSDAEERGYCDPAAPAQIFLRLSRVRRCKIRELYNNTERVKILEFE